MKIKRILTESGNLEMDFLPSEIPDLNVFGSFILFDKNKNTNEIRLVKRGKTETINYLYLDKNVKQFIKENVFELKSQIILHNDKRYLIVELGENKNEL